MKKKEWQLKHKLTDNEMERIEFILKLFKGKIVKVIDNVNLSD